MKLSLNNGPSTQNTYVSMEDARTIFDGYEMVFTTLSKEMRNRISVISVRAGYTPDGRRTNPPMIQVHILERNYPGPEYSDTRPEHERHIILPAGFTKQDVHTMVIDEIHEQLRQIAQDNEDAHKRSSESLAGFKTVWTRIKTAARV